MDTGSFELFSRQMPFIGEENQVKLSKAKVVVVGAGGLGSHVSDMLVRAGVGVVRIIDRDLVEMSNIPRTAVFRREDIGKAKAFVLAEKLAGINPEGRLVYASAVLNDYNAEKFLAGFDVVVDCTDNIESRYAVNKFCTKNKIPWVYGAVIRDEGFSAAFAAGGRPCLSCLYEGKPKKTEKASEAGILGPAVATIASWQAMETIKILTGMAEPDYGKLFRMKLAKPHFELLAIKPWEDCDVCGKDVLKYRRRPS
jgi:molybdopterin/thiamine biosynthesis adenylyltransferase